MAFHAYIMDEDGNWRLETGEREVVDVGRNEDVIVPADTDEDEEGSEDYEEWRHPHA